MTRFLILLIVSLGPSFVTLTTTAYCADTDGDGLRDLVDVIGFQPDLIGAEFNHEGIEDLDGAGLLTSATRLELNQNQITSIESGDFRNLTKLRELRLGGNPISTIEDGAFRGLVSLEELILYDVPLIATELNLTGATLPSLSQGFLG